MIRRLNLNTKKKISSYKSKDTYLNTVYRMNKKFIDEHIEQPTNPKSTKLDVFKEEVATYEKLDGLSTKAALRAYSRSTTFTDVKERLAINAYESLKGDLDAYKSFRELTKVKGKYQKIEMGKFVWNRDEKAYIYDNRIMISFTNSPKETVVSLLDEEEE